jgi:hypothetical protein
MHAEPGPWITVEPRMLGNAIDEDLIDINPETFCRQQFALADDLHSAP